MSPGELHYRHRLHGFPRVSGDEPATLNDVEVDIEFSPRERG